MDVALGACVYVSICVPVFWRTVDWVLGGLHVHPEWDQDEARA